MRILFVTTDNYPTMGTTVNILKKIFFEGQLISKADDISVLTLKYSFNELTNEQIDGVNIHRAASWGVLPLREGLKHIKELSLFDIIKMPITKILLSLQMRILKNPLLRGSNVNAMRKSLKEIDADSYDFIVPIFGNHDSISAALKFKPKKAKIIPYQVDPCSTNWTRPKIERKKTLRFEMQMYDKASTILTMPVIYNEVQHIIPDNLKSKFHLIELPLISKPIITEPQQIDNKKIKCVFSGFIYLGIRDPAYTLRLFSCLIENNNIEFHMVGVYLEDLPVEFRGLNIICHGKVTAEAAQKIMNSADILVNIGNLMNNQLPSKILDYISLGKPIVNVCKNRDCPTLPYMEKYPLSLNLFEEYELLELQKEQLTQFLADSKRKRIEFSEVEKLFENATPKYCADFIYNLLVSLQGKETTDSIQE